MCRNKAMRNIFILLSAVVLVTGCSNAREQLGLNRSAPDEFKVVKRAPLVVPPSFELVPPQPGAARPQEQEPAQIARQTVLGETAGDDPDGLSEAEAALLNQTAAYQAQPGIRQIVDAESQHEDDSDKPVAERLLGISGFGGRSDGEVINPEDEAERLRQAGQADGQ